MGRIRTIKPSYYKHEDLFEAEKVSGLPLRVAFSGLWTVCDREGRFEWKPRTLKTDVMPYDEVDFSKVLDALLVAGFIFKYAVGSREYGMVPSWATHQVINSREGKSVIPGPDASLQLPRRVTETHSNYNGEGKGKEEEGNGGVVTPEMITRAVMHELSLSGRDLSVNLDTVCRAELRHGRDADDLRDQLIASWQDYDKSKPKLGYTKGVAKFFGDGDWKNRTGWPWKPGESPPARKAVVGEDPALKRIRESQEAVRKERGT